MNGGPGVNIGTINVARDNYIAGRDLIINRDSSSEDVLKIIEALQQKISGLDISEKDKRKISNHLDNARIELKDKNPDKNSIGDSIKGVNEILKEARSTGETLKDIGMLVGKAAAWLGTTAVKLGWIF